MSTFDIASGSLQGSYDGVIVSTDLEPDDALCLKVVAPRLQSAHLFSTKYFGAPRAVLGLGRSSSTSTHPKIPALVVGVPLLVVLGQGSLDKRTMAEHAFFYRRFGARRRRTPRTGPEGRHRKCLDERLRSVPSRSMPRPSVFVVGTLRDVRVKKKDPVLGRLRCSPAMASTTPCSCRLYSYGLFNYGL